ncbi:MAG: alpha/beta hydrolase [Serratia marcescens]|jgi:acetyl esterase/lipase|uniref:alpha/beta hydrolase n=1 Tax=Serratia TaxID=613 RepID=UPI00038192C8|nr:MULTISPECIES: alpha/beta hydrolase [Serratia]EMD6650610.1 alpha/beta hydrolase fold domain-containing protein [Serratia marcescens]MBD8464316.1 alpha/beta hydrolase fold domain-containing protein [Serratia marcescens]MBK5574729.1 alpha/beta hydrolase fold domain-containing protein [Serratia marcescens]MBN5265562.1 alpha/beta hydrolase fold domain-containing protein [Serratia marcescens]MBN5404253.1 alpha/beta hydrolase fold domain-containing protein [Serratia marcescens]
MSVFLTCARLLMGIAPKILGNEVKLREQLLNRDAPQAAPIPSALRSSCHIKERVYQEQRVVTLTPRTGKRDLHVLYLHGGAYVNPLLRAHWSIISAVIGATGATVTVPLYALAPENDYRVGTALIDTIYDSIVSARKDEQIVVMGDSAGGNAALTLALRRRDNELSLPDHLILFAPWLDLSLKDAEMRELESRDIMLGVDGLRECGRMWAGDISPSAPSMSPLYADLRGMPPMSIFQGDRDIFVVDARKFAVKAQISGVTVDYHEYSGGFHVFMGLTFLPEAKAVFRQVKAVTKYQGQAS